MDSFLSWQRQQKQFQLMVCRSQRCNRWTGPWKIEETIGYRQLLSVTMILREISHLILAVRINNLNEWMDGWMNEWMNEWKLASRRFECDKGEVDWRRLHLHDIGMSIYCAWACKSTLVHVGVIEDLAVLWWKKKNSSWNNMQIELVISFLRQSVVTQSKFSSQSHDMESVIHLWCLVQWSH